jgi:hypothetical protein
MIARTGSGWQYILADLSLILFMVTAAALAQAEDAPQQTPPQNEESSAEAQPLSPQGQPLAVYRAAPGAPPLGVWLRDQAADARQQLTIVAQYRPGTQAEALSKAEALARAAGDAGTRARIVIEPGEGGTTATLAFDSPAAALVRGLPAPAIAAREASLARSLQESGRNY